MIYFIVLIFSVYSFSFLYVHGKKTFANYIYASVFCIILWTIVQGGQYNVGTDYFTYLYYFDNPYSLSYFSDKGEWGFYFLIKFCHNIGVTGQGVFVVITLLESVLFFIICIKFDKNNPEDSDYALWKSIAEYMDGENAYVVESTAMEGKYVFLGLCDRNKDKELAYMMEQDSMTGVFIGDREGFEAAWESNEYEHEG